MQRIIDDEWRKWIAENLLLDNPPQDIHGALVQNGFEPGAAEQEVQAALASPYLAGGTRLRNRLRKRDWILGVYGELNRMRSGGDRIERRQRLSRDEFFSQYYLLNRPVIITGMLDDWPASQRWTIDYFRSRFGDREVEVQFGRESDPNFEVNQPKLKRLMPFRDYLDLVERTGPTNDFYMTANNSSQNQRALQELWSDIGPLAEYLDPTSADRGFFWFGPAGTKTPFHHDLTNNLMAQVVGRKLIRVLPLCETPRVYNMLHCYSQVDGSQIDLERFPGMRDAQMLECVLAPGEILFLPIGSWHYVEGLDMSVTMTFTNFAANNNFAANYSTYHEL